MALEPPIVKYGLLGAVLVGNVIVAYLIHRAVSRRTGTPEAALEDGALVCPNCGAENGTDFRFCNTCVSALDGSGNGDGDPLVDSGGSPR